MRFLLDAWLPPALARQITSLGYDAEHVTDSGRSRETDQSIRAYAAELGAVNSAIGISTIPVQASNRRQLEATISGLSPFEIINECERQDSTKTGIRAVGSNPATRPINASFHLVLY